MVYPAIGKHSSSTLGSLSASDPMSIDKAVHGKERRNAEFFDVIDTSLKIKTPEEFCVWAKKDLQQIFPHGVLICGIGQIEQQGARIQHLLSTNLSLEYMRALQKMGGMGASPVFIKWLETRRPILFELASQKICSVWTENFRKHDLQNMAAHGQCDLNSHTTSYFCFCKIPGKLTSRHEKLLEMLVPHLHLALIRAFKGAKNKSPNAKLSDLSKREYEILQWISDGKANLEIAMQLGICESTVKNHVHRIFIKLNVSSRTQAVVIASGKSKTVAHHNDAGELALYTLPGVQRPKAD